MLKWLANPTAIKSSAAYCLFYRKKKITLYNIIK